ncbi:MAG: Rho termination factor N-terminal domain-containing protein, partial [Saccharopolyspora sp.]|uniref:Rho termination factor N-terminal domain-containing protein n=1 Tax=Saccharopolyspora sp. TaxID=33915 RepID=UPI0025E03FD4
MSNTELLSSDAANGVPAAGGQDSAQSSGTDSNGTPRRRGGLSGMLLPELRQLAGELGIDTGGLRKGDLIAAIKERQGGGAPQRSRGAGTKQATATQEDTGKSAPESGKAAQDGASGGGKAHQPALDETDSSP